MKKGDYVFIGVALVVVAVVLFFSMGSKEVSSDSIDVSLDSGMSYVMTEVETASVADNCLVVFDGGIYDLTSMIATAKHKPIDRLCGTDITDSGAHGDYLTSKLEKYYVGELE